MSTTPQWLVDLARDRTAHAVDGIVSVDGYDPADQPPETVAIMEKAQKYNATAVFFEAGRGDNPPVAQAFIFCSDGPEEDAEFAKTHRRLWSWGGVPLLYRVTPGLVQLFRCAHKADFESKGKIVFKPFRTLSLAAAVASDPWWDAQRLRNGTLWDDPAVCKSLLSGTHAAQKTLINEVKRLHDELNAEGILPKPLRRKLLILSLLIAYLEARKVFEDGYFSGFRDGATRFFEVLADGPALVGLLKHLEERFNGHVFELSDEERQKLLDSRQLKSFSRLIEARRQASGQLTLWERYSFADLPVEIISHIYQLFVEDKATAVYTPPFLVRLMLDESLDWERLDHMERQNEVILDPCCGSGVFLVEAYKRLVLHWRSRNGWKSPKIPDLKRLLKRVHGVDKEKGAVELAAFSLCLAMCDALNPEEIRASVKLFPVLEGKTLHHGCFFEAREQKTVKENVGAVVGNPPFTSTLSTPAAERAYDNYQNEHGALPDKQLAYLFLHESMKSLAPGGILSMLQQYNFLYNQWSLDFRRQFFTQWDVREILDFISVRGLFQKGNADTKVIVVVAEAAQPPSDRQILHATFRRSGRVDAQQGFDIDYYDLHWLPRKLILTNDGVWRSDLLGGGCVLDFVDRLKTLRTLDCYARQQGWDFGEGFVKGTRGVGETAEHIVGKPLLPTKALTDNGIDAAAIRLAPNQPIDGVRSAKRFTSPMVLIRKHMDLHCDAWLDGYLTYESEIVGFCGAPRDIQSICKIKKWLQREQKTLQAFVAAISIRLFTRKATLLAGHDIYSLPYPESQSLDVSQYEQILVDDIVGYYRDFVRLGEDSAAMQQIGSPALPAFNDTFVRLINGVYKKNPLRALKPQCWPGVICQPYIFGKGTVDWEGTEALKGKLDKLLLEHHGTGLNITRIARVYDGHCIYVLKPDRLRYWLRSIALRDADETLAELWDQGF